MKTEHFIVAKKGDNIILSALQYNIFCNREKKLLHHVAMVAKFLDLNNHWQPC